MDSKGGRSFDNFPKKPSSWTHSPDELRPDIVHRGSDTSRMVLPPTGSPSPPKPYKAQTEEHRPQTRISPSKTMSSPFRTIPSPPKSVSSEHRTIPSPPKSVESDQRTLPSPPKSVPSEQRTIPSPLKTLSSPPKTASSHQRNIPSPRRTLPSPTKAPNEDIIIKSNDSDDDVSVHSLLSIHHKSTSKLERLSLSSSENLRESL